MKELLFVFLGGGLGSVCRYLLSRFVDSKLVISNFPLGTLTVNVLGSFLIGLGFAYIGSNQTHGLRYLLIIGFCGGFTTFSTFSYDALNLLRSGSYLQFSLYVLLSFTICIFMAYLGFISLRQ